MEPDPSLGREEQPIRDKLLSAKIVVPLASLAIMAGGTVQSGGERIKQMALGLESYMASRHPHEGVPFGYQCSDEKTKRVTVRPGDNQWSIEERATKGADLVPRSELHTKTIERNPGDGILQPGDTVIVPKKCWKYPKLQN